MPLFSTFSTEELIERLTALKNELLTEQTGDRFVSISVGGKSFTKSVRTSKDILNEISMFEDALQDRDPVTYGRRVTRTVGGFSGMRNF